MKRLTFSLLALCIACSSGDGKRSSGGGQKEPAKKSDRADDDDDDDDRSGKRSDDPEMVQKKPDTQKQIEAKYVEINPPVQGTKDPTGGEKVDPNLGRGETVVDNLGLAIAEACVKSKGLPVEQFMANLVPALVGKTFNSDLGALSQVLVLLVQANPQLVKMAQTGQHGEDVSGQIHSIYQAVCSNPQVAIQLAGLAKQILGNKTLMALIIPAVAAGLSGQNSQILNQILPVLTTSFVRPRHINSEEFYQYDRFGGSPLDNE